MIILFTSNNAASLGIAKKLIENNGFEKIETERWRKDEILLINTKAPGVLEVPTDFETDLLLILSTHKSKVPGKMLTAHVPGNWNKAEMGGESRTLNIIDAIALKILMQELKKEGERIGWNVSLEADHHGPSCKVPILFVEIGNGEEEWRDDMAADAVANAISKMIERRTKTETQNPKPETVFAVGGGHYPKLFTKLETENSGYAIGHICPKYLIDSLDEETFRQAIEKTCERTTLVIISKEEVNAKQREKILALAKKFEVEYRII